MKISKVKIENFRSIKRLEIEPSQICDLPPFLVPLIMLGFCLSPGSGSGAKGQSSP